jgi:hypothetical protein
MPEAKAHKCYRCGNVWPKSHFAQYCNSEDAPNSCVVCLCHGCEEEILHWQAVMDM